MPWSGGPPQSALGGLFALSRLRPQAHRLHADGDRQVGGSELIERRIPGSRGRIARKTGRFTGRVLAPLASTACATRWRGIQMLGGRQALIDRQALESILSRRFPAACPDQTAAAASALVGLGDESQEVEHPELQRRDHDLEQGTRFRPFRYVESPSLARKEGLHRMAQVSAVTSPLSCCWIERGSETRVSQWTYALCVRIRNNPRVVREEECARCGRWQAPAGQEANGARD
jgi:hypothetical protein